MSRNNGKKVLEWVAGSTGYTAGGAGTEQETARLELGLRDDEIAEIHKVIVNTMLEEDYDAAKGVELVSWLSMDPNSVYAETLLEDLETILYNTRREESKGILVGVETVLRIDREHIYDFDHPILVGTDLGIGIMASTDTGVLDPNAEAHFRVFFTRRKANASELNQILLKRR